MARSPWPVVLLLLLTAGFAVSAEPASRSLVPGESVATSRRLEAADKLAADKQYAAAAEEYARIIEEVGDELVPFDARLSVPVRRLCHLRLAAMPPEVLRTYRTRVDPQAKKWLDAGSADRDTRPLERVLEQAFCSRPAGAAIDLLGDLAFERGQFHQAERWWRMLARPASEAARLPPAPPWAHQLDASPALDLLYPDPASDVARARAKQILAQLFRGERTASKAELEAFRKLHPTATGHLAGRTGNYAEILQAIASRPVPREPGDNTWPTFGGDPSRSIVLPAEPSDPNRFNRLIINGPALRALRLAAQPPVNGKSGNERARHLAFEPIIVGRRVLVADARSVTVVDADRQSTHSWDIAQDGGQRLNNTKGQPLGGFGVVPADARYTVSAADGRVYARLGLDPARPGTPAVSYLVCLELTEPEGKPRLVWVRDADPPPKGYPPLFEGTPVVRDGLLYVAATRFEGGLQMMSEIRCYSADTGGPRWKLDVAAARDFPTTPRYRQHLLTLAGRHVVYVSHAGMIAALDAHTGRRAWAIHYASAPLKTSGGNAVPHDLAPAVYADGRLFCAPADYDRLLCLDPETGQILWERERIAVVQLLGVGSGRLILTTPNGIRAIRARDGSDTDGWEIRGISDHPGLPSYGRGFLAGDYVFWPTVDGIKVLSQTDGLPPMELIPGPLERQGNLPPGNLAYADGILAVADDTALRVYRAQGQSAPVDGTAHTPADVSRRAVALAAAGRAADALAAWQQILSEDRLRRGTLPDTKNLPQRADLVAAERIDELLRVHGRALYASNEEKARALLESGHKDPDALERLVDEYPNAAVAGAALLQLARLHEQAGHWGAAVHAYRRLLQRETTSDEGRAACSGLNRAREHELRRPATDLILPLARSWEEDERLLPLAEESPGGDVILLRNPRDSLRSGATGNGTQPTALSTRRLIPGTSTVRTSGRTSAAPMELACRDVASGAERWAHAVTELPSWAGRRGDCVMAAGAAQLQAFSLTDSTRLWELPAPDAEHFVDSALSSFQIAGGRFYCLQGDCRLLAIDLESGRVLWQNWSPAARLGADVPGCRFSQHYLTTSERVLLQFAGRWRLLDAGTGALLAESPTETLLWPQAPLLLAGGHAALISGRRSVACVDLASGKIAWSYQLPRPDSLSGELPLLLGGGGTLLLVVPRNYGYMLRRFDAASGRPLWSDEVPMGSEQFDAGSIAVDGHALYHASRNLVTARALDDGRQLWQEALPGPGRSWHVQRAGPALLAWPAESRQLKFHSRWLTGGLELGVPVPPEDGPGRGIPVLLLHPKDGQALQRLNLAPPAPRPQARPAAEPELLLRHTATGLVIGWDGRTWALNRDR